MNIVDVTNLFFSVLVGDCNDCDASAFHAVTAAWATKGYWMQAEIIHFLGDTGLGIYASLIYIIAVGAGLIGYMLGNPPRNYLWYLFGPALFNIMLFTTVHSGGVNWQVGLFSDGSPDLGDQAEVWKAAEVGLLNMSIKERLGMTVSSDRAPSGGDDGKVEVAHLFLWVDTVVSDFVQGMIGLLGANFLGNPDGGETNINSITGTVTVPTTQFQQMSGMKWQLLQNITGASIKSPVMAKALGVFLGSECGDLLTAEIDQSSFTASARSKTGELPESVFINHAGAGAPQNYAKLQEKMDGMWISMPQALKDMYKDSRGAPGATANSLNGFSALTEDATLIAINEDSISCTNFLNFLVEAMRWESGNAYVQLIDQAPSQVPPDGVAFALYYGWGVRDESGALLTADDLKMFTVNLMLVHIVKNLFEYTPVSPDQRYSPSEEVQSYIQLQQKTTSSTTKFAEVYSWALMIPYIQGLVMYFLAMAYPVVCVAMIMPGLHKLPLTWIKYWVWIKIWDLGFALVQAIERSVWAMFANNTRTQEALKFVDKMGQYTSGMTFNCTDANPDPLVAADRNCLVPVTVTDTQPAADAFTSYIMPIFDQALSLSVNLELDLANSYYIYIMAALYFAVPALAGQLVGSAGGIASGALDKMTDVKGAAGAGYTSDMNQRMAGFGQSFGQEASFKAQRGGGNGFAVQALRQNNAAGAEGQVAAQLDALNGAESTGQQQVQNRRARQEAQINAHTGGVEKAGNAGQAHLQGNINAAKSALKAAEALVPGAAAPGIGAEPGGGAPGGGAPGAGPGGGAPGAGPGGGGPGGGPGRGRNGGGQGRQRNHNGPAAAPPAGAPADGIMSVADATANLAFAEIAREKGAFEVAAEQAKLDIGHGATQYGAEAEARKSMNSAGAASARMNQGRMQADAGRLSRAGSFAGSEGKWNAMNDLNTKLGGKLGVIGLNFSPYGAGGRSDDAEGGAYGGRLDYGTNDGRPGVHSVGGEARFFGNGGAQDRQIQGFTGAGGTLQTAVNNANSQYRGNATSNVPTFTGANLESANALRDTMANGSKSWTDPGAAPAGPGAVRAPEMTQAPSDVGRK